jgi:hypothetical protein
MCYRSFKNVELVVSKVYYASGIIAITIVYQVRTLHCRVLAFVEDTHVRWGGVDM